MTNYMMAASKVNSRIQEDLAAGVSVREKTRSSRGSVSAIGRQPGWQKSELTSVGNELHILPTHLTPEYIFNNDGFIKISGRGLYCEKPECTDQIVSWINEYLNNPAKTTYIIIAFEFLNSISTAVLVTIFRKLFPLIPQSKKLVVQWYYEPDDENILDRGRYVSSCCDIPIEFRKTSNVAFM